MTCPTACQQTASSIQMTLNSPRNRHDILQNSLNSSASWSKDWELNLNPTKSEHLPISNSSHFVTYTLSSHNPPNAQTIPTVNITKDLGIVLNKGVSAADNVIIAANKTRRMLFVPETIHRGPYSQYISPQMTLLLYPRHPTWSYIVVVTAS